ncbi:MAG: galactose-1-epimerase [Phycisphaeraceae bacterium]|nr:galactose-1-epimerase [Phycisphaeraceae bacterium]
MGVVNQPFETAASGDPPVERWTLTNRSGASASVINYGATIASVRVPDHEGNLGEVSLGLSTFEDYLADTEFLGRTVGRFANRIGGASFELGGRRFALPANEAPNHLHGGQDGFHQKRWVAEDDGEAVIMSCISPDGECGYPGSLRASVRFTFNDEHELAFAFEAETDAPTPINMTNHVYWNLAGAGSGDVRGHLVQIESTHYLETDDGLVPTGVEVPVAGGPLDFLDERAIGDRMDAAPLAPRWQRGYDHCFVLRREAALSRAATVHDPVSGRVMEVLTTQPGMMFYTGNDLSGTIGAGGRPFNQYGGFCLETQNFPDAVNHPHFPNAVLEPGQVYRQRTIFRFSTQ